MRKSEVAAESFPGVMILEPAAVLPADQDPGKGTCSVPEGIRIGYDNLRGSDPQDL